MSWFEEADKEFVRAIQKGIGARVDGYFGPQTLFESALAFHELGIIKLDLPLATTMYGGYLIYANKDQVHFDYSKYDRECRDHKFAVNGIFFNRKTNKIVSIAADEGKVYKSYGSKTWRSKAEGTIYMTEDGEIHWRRFFDLDQAGEDVVWAYSGVSLHDYHPEWEGFTEPFDDVLRYTWHTVLGVTENDHIVAFTKKASAKGLSNDIKNKLKLKYAIMLDGGSMGAIHTPKFDLNGHINQNNMLFFE